MKTTMNRVYSLWLVVLAGLLLAGCGSSPPVRYYTLEPIPARDLDVSPDHAIGVGPLRFPEYLKRPQIVSVGEGGQVVVADFDRWADTAEVAFQRTLAQNISTLIDGAIAIEFPFGGGLISPDYRLLAQIYSFGTDARGEARLDVSWVMVDQEDEPFLPTQRSVFTAQAASTSYADRVGAMNETLRAFSRDVAEQFQRAEP